MSDPRYALYYAPRPEEALARAAGRWLGRSADTGEVFRRQPEGPIVGERLAQVTAEPRLYGFHGTLKAPMALHDGASESDLLTAVGAFAFARTAFDVPAIRLAWLAGFLAMVPAEPCDELRQFADECVTEFDSLRRPAAAAELARRRAEGLSARQESLLQRWGYPYVLDEWRFHLTLTGRITDDTEQSILGDLAEQHFADHLGKPLAVRDVCVFRQPAPGRPFTVLARFALGGGRRLRTESWPAP